MKKPKGKLTKNPQTKKTAKSLNIISLDGKAQQKTIFIKAASSIFPIEIKDIVYCYSSDPVITFIFYSDNTELITAASSNELAPYLVLHRCSAKPPGHECLLWRKRMTMNEAEMSFTPFHFCLVHKSYLINLLHVKKMVVRKTSGNEILMSSDDVVPVSASGKLLFMSLTGRL